MLVGKGVFSKVYRVDRGSVRKKTPLVDEYGVALHCQEVRVLRHLNEKDDKDLFVVKMLGNGQDLHSKWVLMEFLPTTLYQWWAGRLPSATDFATVMRQVCQALDFLESANVCHLDLKADNIMLRENGRCVLIDFGRAVFTNESKKITKAQWLADDDPPSGAYCLMPMEVLLLLQNFVNREPVTQVLTNKVDVYALGATMYHLWTGTHHDGTFPSDFDAVPKLIAKKKEDKAWMRHVGFQTLPKTLRTLVRMMLHVRSEYRISARVAVKYCDMFLETAQQNVAKE